MLPNALLCGFEEQYSAECRGVCLLPAAPVNVRDWDFLTLFFLGEGGVTNPKHSEETHLLLLDIHIVFEYFAYF